MAGITLEQAQTQLDAWISADLKVSQGQAYEIAGRRLTRANAAEITAKIEYWEQKVQALTRYASGSGRARTMVVR